MTGQVSILVLTSSYFCTSVSFTKAIARLIKERLISPTAAVGLDTRQRFFLKTSLRKTSTLSNSYKLKLLVLRKLKNMNYTQLSLVKYKD